MQCRTWCYQFGSKISVCVLASNHCPYANPELSFQGYFYRKAVMTNYNLFVLIYPYVITSLICLTLAKCFRHCGCFRLEGQCLLAFINCNLPSSNNAPILMGSSFVAVNSSPGQWGMGSMCRESRVSPLAWPCRREQGEKHCIKDFFPGV